MDVELVRVVYLYSPYYLYFSCNKDKKFSLKLKIFSKNFLSEGQIFRSEGQFLGSNFSV